MYVKWSLCTNSSHWYCGPPDVLSSAMGDRNWPEYAKQTRPPYTATNLTLAQARDVIANDIRVHQSFHREDYDIVDMEGQSVSKQPAQQLIDFQPT